MTRPIGISLGTFASAVCVLEGGEPVVVVNAEGSVSTPSAVCFAPDGRVLVGEPAVEQAAEQPRRTAFSAARHLGNPRWRFPRSGDVDGRTYTAREVAARILRKLKRDTEARLGGTITDVILSVPGIAGDAHRQALIEAARIAGLNVLRLVNAPTAAGLVAARKSAAARTVVAVNLDGGSLDVSVQELTTDGVEVRATTGDTTLGGEDWAERILGHLAAEFRRDHGINLTQDPATEVPLFQAARSAMADLSVSETTTIALPGIVSGPAGPLDLKRTLTRAAFGRLTDDLAVRCRQLVHQALKNAAVSAADVNDVLLVGDAVRVPFLGDLVSEVTGKPTRVDPHPETIAAAGAALLAGLLSEGNDGTVLDVTPYSVGIETRGDIMTRLFERDTTIPARRVESFTTGDDDEPEISIHVLQGEAGVASHNTTVCRVRLTDIKPAPRGVPQIEVTFALDANGVVQLTAKDLGTGKPQPFEVITGSALPPAELDRLICEAH
ncbi:Hsp70 family protein [Streptomyces sp. NPDC007084]|uniref:Hsp70 family protein n=1 Tax=Streptomyces sp. NPDC007084 TaxID=3154313 RepID=UPI0034536C48